MTIIKIGNTVTTLEGHNKLKEQHQTQLDNNGFRGWDTNQNKQRGGSNKMTRLSKQKLIPNLSARELKEKKIQVVMTSLFEENPDRIAVEVPGVGKRKLKLNSYALQVISEQCSDETDNWEGGVLELERSSFTPPDRDEEVFFYRVTKCWKNKPEVEDMTGKEDVKKK